MGENVTTHCHVCYVLLGEDVNSHVTTEWWPAFPIGLLFRDESPE